jgi:hypothetical protein
MEAFETIPVAGESPNGPEEDKKMKACPLVSAHVEYEAKENGPQDMEDSETSHVAKSTAWPRRRQEDEGVSPYKRKC